MKVERTEVFQLSYAITHSHEKVKFLTPLAGLTLVCKEFMVLNIIYPVEANQNQREKYQTNEVLT